MVNTLEETNVNRLDRVEAELQANREAEANRLVRMNRDDAFKEYDKYQLPLIWNELTKKQKDEYISWRKAWLDLLSPEPLEWFK